MRILAVILARSGSKGVPGKNARRVCGRPCLEWTIDHALEAKAVGAIDDVVLSTDGDELALIASALGVRTIERPAELATDMARVDDAARHCLAEYQRGGAGSWVGDGGVVDAVMILYGNVPVRPAGLLERASTLLRRTGADSVQSYTPVGKHHPWWTCVVESEPEAQVRPWQGDVLNHGVFRRQDLPPAHMPDGGVLLVTSRALRLEIPGVQPGPHAFFGADRRGIINPEGSVVDIDSEIDLLVADAVLRQSPGGVPW